MGIAMIATTFWRRTTLQIKYNPAQFVGRAAGNRSGLERDGVSQACVDVETSIRTKELREKDVGASYVFI
jgi:hypothetical protein